MDTKGRIEKFCGKGGFGGGVTMVVLACVFTIAGPLLRVYTLYANAPLEDEDANEDGKHKHKHERSSDSDSDEELGNGHSGRDGRSKGSMERAAVEDMVVVMRF